MSPCVSALIGVLAILSGPCIAQTYPNKPARVIVPYSPGSTPDIIARVLSGKLQEKLGQPFVVLNRTGAAGNVGAEVVAKAPADGYTLLVAINGPAAINKFLYKNLTYDSGPRLVTDFAARVGAADVGSRAESQCQQPQ